MSNKLQTTKLLDVEDKQRPLHEKARKFLEKNMEQTALNRDLEDRIKVLNENNNKLVSFMLIIVYLLSCKNKVPPEASSMNTIR